MIDLQEFCATDEMCRPAIEKPFPKGEFTYATDGQILIRVSRSEFPSEEFHLKHPDPTTVAKYDHDSLSDWTVLERCKGSGKTPQCKECRGCGRCECDCGHEHDCGYCDGTGKKGADREVCEHCENGKIETRQVIAIGAAKVHAKYLRKIATLPEPLIAVPATWDAPIAFKFTGGVGYVMPMRTE